MADLDRLIAWLGTPHPLDDDSHTRKLKPETCKQYRTRLLRLAAEMVHAGVPAEELTSVTALLDPVRADHGLRQMLGRNGDKTSRQISETARLLPNLANKLGADEETKKGLSKIARKLSVAPQKGMTQKNRERLRVLQEPNNQIKVLTLPDRVFARPIGKNPARRPSSPARTRSPSRSCSIARSARRTSPGSSSAGTSSGPEMAASTWSSRRRTRRPDSRSSSSWTATSCACSTRI